jgi:hypothetical protein
MSVWVRREPGCPKPRLTRAGVELSNVTSGLSEKTHLPSGISARPGSDLRQGGDSMMIRGEVAVFWLKR